MKIKSVLILLIFLQIDAEANEDALLKQFVPDYEAPRRKPVSQEQEFLTWLNDSGLLKGNKLTFPRTNITLDWGNAREQEIIKQKIPKLKKFWLHCCAGKKYNPEILEIGGKSLAAAVDISTSSWWEGSNVCIVKEQQYKKRQLPLPKHKNPSMDGMSIDAKKFYLKHRMNEAEYVRQKKIFQSLNKTKSTICNDTKEKYQCSSSLQVYGLTRTWSLIHQCCNNYRKSNITGGCVPDERLNLMDTLRKIGVTDFKKILMKEKIPASILENVTLFAPSNDMFRGLVGFTLTESGYFDPRQINQLQFHKEKDMLAKLKQETIVTSLEEPHIIEEIDMEEIPEAEEIDASEIHHHKYSDENRRKNSEQDKYKITKLQSFQEKPLFSLNDELYDPTADSGKSDEINDELIEETRKKREVKIVDGYLGEYKNETKIHRRTKRSANGFIYSMKDVIMNQIIPGRIDLKKLKNDEILYSLLEHSSIRINIFGGVGKKRYAANCIPFHKYVTNIEASNGMVHKVSGLVPPATKTIWDIIMKSNNHTIFRKIIRNRNFSLLFNRKKPYTLLIPTDAAFKYIEEKSKRELLEGTECGKAIIRNHILPNVVLCASMIKKINVTTLERNKLMFTNHYDKGILINKVIRVLRTDIIGSNGVIHVIDRYIVPDSGLLLSQILKKYKFTHFQEILQSFADLSGFWDNMRRKTLFIPIDKALNTKTQTYFEKSFDDETYFNYLKYHISPYFYATRDFVNNMLLDTQADDTIGRINLYSSVERFNQTDITVTKITWNCMEIIQEDIECCGIMVHAINRVAIPPTGTIYDTLQVNNEFSIVFEILNGTEIAEMLQDEELSATFLAPPNAILQLLSPKDMDTLLHDPAQANDLLSHHLLKEVLCCSGIGNKQLGFTNEIQTYAGKPKVYSRDDMNHIHIGEAIITVCDIMASNGIIHQVSSFAIGPKKTGTISKSDIFPYAMP